MTRSQTAVCIIAALGLLATALGPLAGCSDSATGTTPDGGATSSDGNATGGDGTVSSGDGGAGAVSQLEVETYFVEPVETDIQVFYTIPAEGWLSWIGTFIRATSS